MTEARRWGGLHFGCGEIRGSVNGVPERSRAPQPLGGALVSRSENGPACED